MSVYCDSCECDSCIFYMEDKCCIKDLFIRLARYTPVGYENVYINWYDYWEAKYNELHKQTIK